MLLQAYSGMVLLIRLVFAPKQAYLHVKSETTRWVLRTAYSPVALTNVFLVFF